MGPEQLDFICRIDLGRNKSLAKGKRERTLDHLGEI